MKTAAIAIALLWLLTTTITYGSGAPHHSRFATPPDWNVVYGDENTRIDLVPWDVGVDFTTPCVVGPDGDVWAWARHRDESSKESYEYTAYVLRTNLDGAEAVYSYPYGSGLSTARGITVSPDGRLYLGKFAQEYLPGQNAVRDTGVTPPDLSELVGSFFFSFVAMDPDLHMYCGGNEAYEWLGKTLYRGYVWQMAPDQKAVMLYGRDLAFESTLFCSRSEFWYAGSTGWGAAGIHLVCLDLSSGSRKVDMTSDNSEYRGGDVRAMDAESRLWLTSSGDSGSDIRLIRDGQFETFTKGYHGGIPVEYVELCLTADWTVWSFGRGWEPHIGARFREDKLTVFTEEDGLSQWDWSDPVIDYDGNIWKISPEGFTCIQDGGWPPMRLILDKLETPESVAVTAQVINNGPVVGVDVYIAIELNGQLLFYPTWGPEPFPNQINLSPGHNQTATIIDMPRESVPPGSYTVYGCMTGRNTQKLIGPIGRKFEAVVVEVE